MNTCSICNKPLEGFAIMENGELICCDDKEPYVDDAPLIPKRIGTVKGKLVTSCQNPCSICNKPLEGFAIMENGELICCDDKEPYVDDAPLIPKRIGTVKGKLVTSCQNPCDKVSHERHIEYDKVSHDSLKFGNKSCFDCFHFEYAEENDGSEMLFCHHDSVRDSMGKIKRNCELFEVNNGSVSR